MKVALLTPAPGYPEAWDWAFDVEARALRDAGIEVVSLAWTELDGDHGCDLVLPLVAWGYNLDYPRWLDFLDRAEREVWPLLNPPALLRWNGDKAYLEELGSKGIPTVATVEVDALDGASLAEAAQRLGGPDMLVVKPPISGGAEGTYRLAQGDAIPADVVGRRMMVQPFQPTIANGEWSLILFGGQLSHCILKTPKAGDFRVQPHVGGVDTPADAPAGALDLARAALAAAPADALYARVDIIADAQGKLKLMELELIEPALFLHHAPDNGAMFASAVLAQGAH
jgi:glutathione synthase/RimK-type ligase-like ATP-grasp enzyme